MPHLDKTKKQEYFKRYYQEHKAAWAAKYAANKSDILEQKRLDREKRADEYRAREALWSKNNPDAVNAKIAKRRASKLQATPKWLTAGHHIEIKEFYRKASELTKTTGVTYSVDHEVPLRGKQVCGLHVPWNLRVITKLENIKKGNRY